MKSARLVQESRIPIPPQEMSEEISDFDNLSYNKLASVSLDPDQIERVVAPVKVYPMQTSVLGIHWHPEFVPMELIVRRICATFPNSENELIIPTQHNRLTSFDGFTGVEIDCYSKSFHRKVQLLVHFTDEKLQDASVFKKMLDHTFKYRSSQLDEFMDSILNTRYEDRLQKAASMTGADEELVDFVRVGTAKLKKLIELNFATTPPEMLRNKILTSFFDFYRDIYGDRFIARVLVFLKAVKEVVKQRFSLDHFYEINEFIEEIRLLGGGIIIPHPEQFWPILLADYDVDGYEVWNPQSQEFTEFLINVVHRVNYGHDKSFRPLLVTMGDDCHMGEKVKEPRLQDPEKAGREIGVQPAWEDLAIRKSLITAGYDRERTIREYRDRLR